MLLTSLLGSPSTSISEIHARQSLVAFFHARPHIRDDLTQLLSNMDDATRIVQKFLLGRGNTYDLSALNQAITAWSSIRQRIKLERRMEAKERGVIEQEEWDSLDSLMTRMDDLASLSLRISASITRGDPYDIQEEEAEGSLDPAISLSAEIMQGMKWSIKSE
jgi:DNA mismatch repair ATPase MutS